MKLNQKIAVLLAFVLAAVLSLSGCGGGTASGTVPTATITSAAGTGGTVVFTIAFNESVGTTFNAGEVTVTGGTAASSVTSIGSNSYTLVVTPTSGATSVVATLPINKVTDINGNSNTVEAKNTYTVPTASAPTTAPTAPTRAAANVISIYGEAYTQTTGVNLNPGWGQAGSATEVTIAGNKSQNLANFNYQGIDFAGNAINVSASTGLHIDVWTPNVTELDLYVISINGLVTKDTDKFAIMPTQSGWSSVDIPLTAFPGVDLTSVAQIKLTNGPTVASGGTVYYDNLYFYKTATTPVVCGTTTPTCAPSTTIPSGAVTIYSDASTTAGFVARPDWGQATQFSEQTIAGNKSLMYSNLNYEGIGMAAVDVSSKGKVHLDIWSADMTSVKFYIVSLNPTKDTSGVVINLTPSSWNSVDIDLSSFATPNKAAIEQMKFDTALPGAGTMYVDNIYFWGAAGAGGGSGSGGASSGNTGGTTGTLNFMTGFKTATTVEGGAYGGTSGSSLDGWNCPGNSATATTSCGSGGSFTDGSSPAASAAVSSFYAYYQFKGTAPTGEYAGINVFAPGVTAISGTADTAGMVLNGQTTVSFNLGMNAEFFSNSNHNVAVLMNLGKHYAAGGGCNLQLQTVFTPTSAASTSYTLPLSSFAVAQDCATGTPPTGYAAALTASPAVSQIAFQAASGASAFHPNLSGSLTSGANTTVANGTYIPTTLSLTGGISFQ